MGSSSSKKMCSELKNKSVVIPASGSHSHTLIFLHGLGDTGHGWAATLASEVRSDNVKIICPTANTMPVTLNSGFEMPCWFDLYGLDANGPEDEEGIAKSSAAIEGLIEAEVAAGTPQENIFLGGFSQGGALAMYTGLTSKKYKLGGIIGLSCWLPLHKKVTVTQKTTPMLQCHGDCDPVVPYKWGQLTSTYMKSMGIEHYEFKSYRGMAHSSSEEELADVKSFLIQLMNKIN